MSFGPEGDNPSTETTPATPATTEAPATTELPPEILKKIEHQDAHIKTLEAEAKERDEKLITLLEKKAAEQTTESNKEDFIELVKSLRSTTTDDPKEEPSPGQEISIEEITNAVGDKLKESQLAAKREDNLNSCMDKAEAAYGEDFNKTVMSKATEKGMSASQLNELAQNNPLVFAELFLPAENPANPGTTRSTGNQGDGLKPADEQPSKSFLHMTSKQRAARVQQLIKQAEGNS